MKKFVARIGKSFVSRKSAPPSATPTTPPSAIILLNDYMLYKPTLIRPQKKEVEVSQHRLFRGDRVRWLEERSGMVVIETRQDTGGGEVRKGCFLITEKEWSILRLRGVPADARQEILDKYSRKETT